MCCTKYVNANMGNTPQATLYMQHGMGICCLQTFLFVHFSLIPFLPLGL